MEKNDFSDREWKGGLNLPLVTPLLANSVAKKRVATPSKCGESVRVLATAAAPKGNVQHWGNALGMVKTQEIR